MTRRVVISTFVLFLVGVTPLGVQVSAARTLVRALDSREDPLLTCGLLTLLPGGYSDDEREIFALVNRERGRHRLAELDWDERLAKVARNYSRQMAREGFFDHHDRKGKNVIDRAFSSRIVGWRKIGENLYSSSSIERFSESAVRGWLLSSSHRHNLLDRNWTATGIGIAESRDGKIYVTQVFIQE